MTMRGYGPPTEATPATTDEKVAKLAAIMHLEWCDSCADCRDVGHKREPSHQAMVDQGFLLE